MNSESYLELIKECLKVPTLSLPKPLVRVANVAWEEFNETLRL